MGSADVCKGNVDRTMTNICKFVDIFHCFMPHTTVYICTLPVNPEHEYYDLAKRVNAELRSIWNSDLPMILFGTN